MNRKMVFELLSVLILSGALILAFNVQPVKATETVYMQAKSSHTTIIVPDDYLTIQQAINNSSSGDTIYVRNGVYHEFSIVVNKSIVLLGESKSATIIDAGLEAKVIEVTENNVSITGFTLRNTQCHAIFGETYGIILSNVKNCIISGNTITSIRGFKGIGIVVSKSSNTSIFDNTIGGNIYGIRLEIGSSNNTISRNRIGNNDDRGIVLSQSSDNTINDNNITQWSSGYGIYFDSSSNNTLYGNNIRGAAVNAYLFRSFNNLLYHNNFYTHVSGWETLKNTWDNGYPLGSNYWSSYKSTDLFSGFYQNVSGSDGIGDTPFVIDQNNTDRYPLIFPSDSPPTAPVAEFSIWSLPQPGRAGESMTFNASFSLPSWNGTHVKPIIEYRWDFGDGSVKSTVNPVVIHTYSLEGTYDVSLVVQDSEGEEASCVQTIGLMMPTFLSISTSPSSTLVGFQVDIKGTLQDVHKNAIAGQTVVLYYTFSGANTTIPITSATTDNLGRYSIAWIPPATGYFTLKASWFGNATHLQTK